MRNETESMSVPVQVGRWIAVLPAAFISVLLTTFPIHWIVMLIPYLDRPDDAIVTVGNKGLLASIQPEMLERFGDALFLPIVLIIVGAKVAPRYPFLTGIVLAILWTLLMGVAVALILNQGGRLDWRIFVALVLGIVGMVIGLYRALPA